jgi:1-acyl-sn-glycerol-3-phosphate acyltransferase
MSASEHATKSNRGRRRQPRSSALLAVLRVAPVVGWTVLTGLVGLVGAGLRRIHPRSGAFLQGLALRGWARGLLFILGARVEVRGTPPRPPFLLVTNHLSYVDIPVLASLTHCVFVSKHDVADWPGIGILVRAVGTIFIDRSRPRDVLKVMEQMNEARELGSGVVFFPEGTSTKGERVTPLKPALLDAAVRSGQPVHYGVISYRTPEGEPPAHQAICFWGDAEFASHAWGLLGLSGFTVHVTFGNETLLEEDRKTLARRLQLALERDFNPSVAREVGG